MSRRFLIRCDAGKSVGLGHVVRCGALADALIGQGAEIVWLVAHDGIEMPPDVTGKGVLHTLPIETDLGTEIDAIQRLARVVEADAMILDTYRADATYQQRLRNETGLPWLQFDCAMRQDPLWAQWVVCPMPGMAESDYAARQMQAGTRFFLGPQYAVLRPGFRPVAQECERSARVARIAVVMGGVDGQGGIFKVLQALELAAPGAEVAILTTGANPRLEQLQGWIVDHPAAKATLHVDAGNFVDLLANADFVVTAAGMTLIECAALGVPALAIAMVENQERNASAWHALGSCLNAGRFAEVEPAQLADKIRALAAEPELRVRMRRNGLSAVDGMGASRLAEALLGDLRDR